jgi:hypothetical protein
MLEGHCDFVVMLWLQYVVGSDVPLETVDSAAVFLFNVFLRDQTWSRSHAEEIKRALGPFPASAASDACNAVKQIIGLLPEDWECKVGDLTREPCNVAVKEFGHNIVFKHSEPEAVTSSGYDSLSDDEFGAHKSELLSGLVHGTGPSMQVSGPSMQVSGPSMQVNGCVREGEAHTTAPAKYTQEWLKEQCQSCSGGSMSGGLEWRDLYSAVFDLLSSCKEDSGIENNVCVHLLVAHFNLTVFCS